MLGSKSASRLSPAKKSGNFRYATRLLTLDKGKRSNQSKEAASLKACESLLKSDGWKGTKHPQNNSKSAAKKTNGNKNITAKDVKNKSSTSNRHEKVVYVSKRSASFSVVKSDSMRRSVSVRKVSFSTSVLLSSEEGSESDEESEDESEDEYTEKKAVLKRPAGRPKSNYSEPKISDNKATKKGKSQKLSKEKATPNKKKSSLPARELRPRFPYSATQELPTARTHRMASLNALAKVHVLYENEGRSVSENGNEGDDVCIIDLFNEDSDEEEKISVKKEEKSSQNVKNKNNEKPKSKSKEKNETDAKSMNPENHPPKQTRKRKFSGDAEIIDTKICRRMACLNAQAMLAASYLQEKPKKVSKKVEKCEALADIKEVTLKAMCDINIVEGKKSSTQQKIDNSKNCNSNVCEEIRTEIKETNLAKNVPVKLTSQQNQNRSLSPIVLLERRKKKSVPTLINNSNSSLLTTAASKVTQYTEITEVQINTRKEVEIKEEAKSDKHGQENDDVAITQMFHYQARNVNESYSLKMQATYKPSSKNVSSGVQLPPSRSSLPRKKTNYYNNSPKAVPSPNSYQPVNIIPPVAGMEHCIPRQYGGSAFTVPHYAHSQHVQYPHSDFGYYQPAGPLIQPLPDQCTIHKPVPYHPQQLLQQPQIPPPPVPPNNVERYAPMEVQLQKKNNSIAGTSHVSNSSQQSMLLAQPNMPLMNVCSSTAVHGTLPNVDHNQPSPINLLDTRKQHIPAELGPSPYSPQNNIRGYLPQSPNPQSYSNNYDQKIYSTKHYNDSALNYNVYHNDEKNRLNPNSQLMPQEPIHHLDTNSKHSPIVMHHQMFSSHSENSAQDPVWQEPIKGDVISTSSASFNPYINEPINKEPFQKQPSNILYPARPPSVMEITEESSRDTKTYIQLEVPNNRFREKIVVVDVESDECLNKDDGIQSIENLKVDSYLHAQEKIDVNPAKKICENAVRVDTPLQENQDMEKSEDSMKESPDIMVIEVKKRKESAVIRRARLHGKQRTFRDCYNRPLAPLNKAKKNELAATEHQEEQLQQPSVPLPELASPKPNDKKISHQWSWEGTSFEKLIYLSNDNPPCVRQCYPSIRHHEGDVIKVRDCVLLRSGIRKTDLPFVAKITALWENPSDGEMTMSLLWYYRPEHTEHGKMSNHTDDEIFASKHKDINSVACIEDKCYVLTLGEYCRYRRQFKLTEENCKPGMAVVPEPDEYPRKNWLPQVNTSSDMVFFCRYVYDYRQRRLLKNPT